MLEIFHQEIKIWKPDGFPCLVYKIYIVNVGCVNVSSRTTKLVRHKAFILFLFCFYYFDCVFINWLFICLFISFIYLFIYLSIYLSIYLFIDLSIYLFIHLSVLFTYFFIKGLLTGEVFELTTLDSIFNNFLFISSKEFPIGAFYSWLLLACSLQ